MADKRSNRLLIVIVAAVLLMVMLVTCTTSSPKHTALKDLPSYNNPPSSHDGDSTADTIKALQAYAKAAESKVDAFKITTEARFIDVATNTQALTQLAEFQLDTINEQDVMRGQLDQINAQLRQMNEVLNALKHTNNVEYLNGESADLPVGFGFDDDGKVEQVGQWYETLDRVHESTGDSTSAFTPLLAPMQDKQQNEIKPVASHSSDTLTQPKVTLPKDTMLTDGVAVTALIGRIPVKGQTPDPYPIKIFIGEDNITANGHRIPEVEGMIFSGLGIGDWNLSCVSARLYSATFIFADGTIVNHTSDEPLAYISDQQGVPCISGRFVSNAGRFLTQRIGLAGISAAGSAYAESQQQNQISTLTGNTTRQLIGDLNKVAAGHAVQAASDEIGQWLLDRQQQSFDAVVVDPGATVAVHLNRSLFIDYQPQARKIRYANTSSTSYSSLD